MGEQKSKKQSSEDVLADAEKQLKKMKKVEEKDLKSAKDSKKSSETEDSKKDKKKNTKAVKEKRAKRRSKKYLETVKDLDRSRAYDVEKAISLAKKLSYTKFDGSIDLSIRLVKKKSTQPIRTIIELPSGRAKKPNVVVLDEKKIEEIGKTKKINFDIAIVSPELMPKVARIAKILGPKGKMPNPKSGTITNDIEKTKKELEGGKVEIKENDQAIIHQIVGKVSWDDEKIIENIQAIRRILPQNRLLSMVVSATMSPGIKIDISK